MTDQHSRSRALVGWLAVAAAVLTVWLLAGPVTSGAGAQEDEVARGAELYQRNCAVCHGSNGTGVEGVAPPITDFSAPRVDLSMRTGRMPMDDVRRGIRQRSFNDAEREATMAYMVDKFDLEGELTDPPPGDPGVGQDVYSVNCAQCHGAAGDGGVAGDGVEIPPVVGLDEVTIATASRVGPFAMPQFSADLISDEELGHIAAFLDEEVHQPNSPLGLEEVGELDAIFFAALLTVTVLLVCVWAAGLRGRRPAPPPGEEEG